MERRVFLRNTLIGTSAVVLTPAAFLESCKPTEPTGCAEWQFGSVNYLDVISPNANEYIEALPIIETRSAIGASLKASKLNVALVGINQTACYGYFNDNIWGPTLKLASGDNLSVDFENGLDTDTNVMFHGLTAPADNDGNPLNVISAGGSVTYNFTVNNNAGLYWYHAHVNKLAGKQLHLGLGGLVWVTGGDEIGLGLPSGERELHLVLSDKRFNEDGTLTYSPNISEKLSGYHGAGVFANGKHAPFHSVKTRKYRVRIINASNARIFNLALDNDLNFTIIGGDGGLLEAPQSIGQITLAPGERVDTIINFSELAVGTKVILRSTTFSNGGTEGGRGFDIMMFSVDDPEGEGFVVPGTLSTINPPSPSSSRTLNISNGGIQQDQLCDDSENIHEISGEIYDAAVVNFTVDAGSSETWVFDNSNGKEARAMHVQGAQGIMTTREGGRGNIKQWEKGWKDTFLCLPGEKVSVDLKFSNYLGKYVVYTTNMENADTGLMNIFEIV